MVCDAVVSEGIVGLEEFKRAHAELVAFTDDPLTLIAKPRLIQVWGRRPH